ncbi:MAG: aminotransferase class I/II-fold pyridoxal phosphate-dependent enzyme [Acidobacteria bacterium]|nr:aminotransferase class I/II-fold pyridoxal phosphate-dependent enzyme [Acidobacteriota bacterium]
MSDRARRWRKRKRKLRLETLLVHAGERLPTPLSHPSTTPIQLATAFESDSALRLDQIFGGQLRGYVYSRYANPTTEALEETLAALDGGQSAIAFSSGMAALHAAFLSLELSPGCRLLASRDLYGATYTLFRSLLAPFGVEIEFLDLTDMDSLRAALKRKPQPRGLFLEVLTNPLLYVIDVQQAVRLCRRAGVPVIVDNTFATPLLLRPLELGAALVVHSTTKYLAGHGDVTGGVAAALDAERAAALRTLRKIGGGTPGPFDSWLALRGVKTLSLRMSRICDNALAIASFLERHPRVERVRYPGLRSHPQHATAVKLFEKRGYGGLVAFEIRNADKARVLRFMDRLTVIGCATTLGDIYSQLLYPRISSHRELPPRQRMALGICDNLVRLSVGIEHPDDLIDDLTAALGE